ncbi:aldo/keto reductase [Microbacterium sp. SYP-A9085]|uniref:aldo/keto reductase family protein n=1 Tax=Microbacterium sp. SYP-A9085 TaxID=2664454 RepID=UPI00129AC51D|nr:aldo/keto reductase family protein [Microbacterium sp. SYP-A9085]MRH28052.1 aldo/keto reductase [Microbacterium sp. SYP-A9085]
MVTYRYLGDSGLKVSEITYGNWITHGSQVGDEVATRTVHAALDAGITTFDTSDNYANGRAEAVLGGALAGRRRESLEIFTKVYFPTGRLGPNDTGLSRKHIMESIAGSLRRLGTDYVDLYQAHRFDYGTPLEETMQAFADLVRQGKVLYVGVSEWTAEQLREGHALAKELGVRLISSQTQYSMLWRVIEGRIIPTSAEIGVSQLVFSPMAQGVLSGKYVPGRPVPAGSRAAESQEGARFLERFMGERTLTAVQALRPVAERVGLTMPQLAIAWVLQNPGVASAIVGASRPEQLSDTVKASGVTLDAQTRQAIDDILSGVVVDDPELTESMSFKNRLV